jgi:hypothetical protein
MTWAIHFIPNETDHVDVTINGDFFHTWKSSEGDTTVTLTNHKDDPQIHVLAVGLEGKNATIEVQWDGATKKKMDFDGKDGENHDVHN